MEKNSEEIPPLYVKLVKQENKKYLFFDNYKVSSENCVVMDFPVSVPKQSMVCINDVKIPEEYLSSEKNGYETMKTYKIPKIFSGACNIKIETLGFEEKNYKGFEIEQDGEFYACDFTLAEESLNEITNVVKEFTAAKFYGMEANDITLSLPYVSKDFKDYFTTMFKEHCAKDPGPNPTTYRAVDSNCQMNKEFCFEEPEIKVTGSVTLITDDNREFDAGIYDTLKYEDGKWLVADPPFKKNLLI